MKVPKICNKNIQLNLPDFSIFCLQIWLASSNCFLQLPLPRREECWCTREFINVHLQKLCFGQYVGIAEACAGRSGSLQWGWIVLPITIPKPGMLLVAFPHFSALFVLTIWTMIYVPGDVFGACVCVFSLGDREADCS